MKPELKLDLLRGDQGTRRHPAGAARRLGNPDDEIGQAVKLGINKINISSDIKVAYHDKMREVLGTDRKLREPNAIQPACDRRPEGDRRPEDPPVRRRGQGRTLLRVAVVHEHR